VRARSWRQKRLERVVMENEKATLQKKPDQILGHCEHQFVVMSL
jgi:hypothetical protein